MKKHSRISKLLHKVYLKNYFISKATLDYEIDKFKHEINNKNLDKIVFISGLARSGTTSLLRELYSTNNFSSLQYNNMPFLFLPNTWVFDVEDELSERAHKDGIKVNGASPEEFDEYFWKSFLKDSYIGSASMDIHTISDVVLAKYSAYMKLIAISKNSNSYLSKNNNNILRISSLVKIPNSFFFFLIRKPLDHASSLLKLHLRFSKDHQEDSFALEYFDFLGHHEFGLNHKPFRLKEAIFETMELADKTSISYWLLVWKQYYSYLLDTYKETFHFVLFEDLINNKRAVYTYINEVLGITIPLDFEDFKPPVYENFNSSLLDSCNQLYDQLSINVKYK